MASKRPYEEDVSEELEERIKRAKAAPNSTKKHSLDSDEESDSEDKRKYEILDEDDIEGQEEGVVGMEGEVKITPFNMREEMEEGHFDTEGNYHWKKETEIKDNWLDNIDWVKVKEIKTKNLDGMDSGPPSPIDERAIYRNILQYMEPGETVARALQRLGGGKTLSASERLKRKKAGLSIESSSENSKKVTELTELANKLLTKSGNMDIYQETYEFIKNMTEQSSSKESSSKSDGLDMYADDFDSKEKEKLEKKEENESVLPKKKDKLMWEYKLKKDAEKIEGPCSSEQMQEFVVDGTFKEEVWVRKVGQEGPFYSSRRIDFELYT